MCSHEVKDHSSPKLNSHSKTLGEEINLKITLSISRAFALHCILNSALSGALLGEKGYFDSGPTPCIDVP